MDFLREIEKQLDMTLADKAEVMRELTGHFDELHDEFVASGMDAAQAQSEAERHMGAPADIAARLNAAHNSASWKSALLCAVPFAASAVYLITSALTTAWTVKLAALIAIGAVMLTASARQLVNNRRPIWLTTWLAAGLLCVPGLLYQIGGVFNLLPGLKAGAYAVLFLAAVVLVFGFTTHRMLKVITIACQVAVSSSIWLLLTMSWVATLIMVVSAVVLLVVLAKLVFETHTYGSALQAVLFLLGVFVLRLTEPASFSEARAQTVGVIFSALAVIWFARTARRGAKALACYCALFAYALATQAPLADSLDLSKALAAIVPAAFSAAFCHVIVVSPLYPFVRDDVNRMTLAR